MSLKLHFPSPLCSALPRSMVRHLPSLVLVEQGWPEPHHRLQSVGAELRAGYENRGLRQLASKNRTATAPPAAPPSHPLPPCTPLGADTCCSVYHRHTGLETSVCASGAHANPVHTEPLTWWGKQHSPVGRQRGEDYTGCGADQRCEQEGG